MSGSDPLDQEPLDHQRLAAEEHLFDTVWNLTLPEARVEGEPVRRLWYPPRPVGNKAGRNGLQARLKLAFRPKTVPIDLAPTLILCPWEGCVIRHRTASIRPVVDGELMTAEEIIRWCTMVDELSPPVSND